MNTGSSNNLPDGLYVLRRDREEVSSRIVTLSEPFKLNLQGKQVVAKSKECKYKITVFLEECFEETSARNKCKRRLEGYLTDDVSIAREYGQKMLFFLINLKGMMPYFVRFDDLPSCRSLLDYSPEEAAVKAADLCGNGIVKASAHILAIGSKLYDFKTISDVWHYYTDSLTSFQKDVSEGWKLSPVEHLFENKANMELEYCKLATLKTAGKLTEDIMEVSREVINSYKNRIEQ